MPRGVELPDVRLSKKLSKLLRHRIAEAGLSSVLRPDGFLPLDRVLATPGFAGVSVADVERVVAGSDKQRFGLRRDENTNVLLIRANQGHTLAHGLDDEALLERLPPPPDGPRLAVHGTYRTCLAAIIATGGLSRMSRRHIHMAVDVPGVSGVISGMRASADVHIWVDLASARESGVPLFRAANGVILTPGLPASQGSPQGVEENVACLPFAEGILPLAHFAKVLDAQTGKQIPGPWDSG